MGVVRLSAGWAIAVVAVLAIGSWGAVASAQTVPWQVVAQPIEPGPAGGDAPALPGAVVVSNAELPRPVAYRDPRSEAERLAGPVVALRIALPRSAYIRRPRDFFVASAVYVSLADTAFSEGVLVTAELAVRGSPEIKLVRGGREVRAEVVEASLQTGLALVSVDPSVLRGLTPVPISDGKVLNTLWLASRGLDEVATVAERRPGPRGSEALAFYIRFEDAATIGAPLLDQEGALWGITGLVGVKGEGEGWAINAAAIQEFLTTILDGPDEGRVVHQTVDLKNRARPRGAVEPDGFGRGR